MATTNKERDAVMRAAIDRSFAELAKPPMGVLQVIATSLVIILIGAGIGKFLL